MYHIVFSADENYIKYTSVLMTSIVLNTDKEKVYEKNEKYVFHILSNFLSDGLRKKLTKFEKVLNSIFPCQIKIHIFNDNDFKDFPLSGAAHTCKLPYYRLRLNLIFDDDVEKCLYLDSDMLCLCDIRELFYIDLTDKIIAVVGDPGTKKSKIKYKENNKKITLKFDENYFNSGFLLINVKEYKYRNIDKECQKLAKKCFYIKAADQDLLNATIEPRYRIKLNFSYNFNIITLLYAVCSDEKKNRLNYTRAEFIESMKNPKILHYGEKPWKFLKSYTDFYGKNINDYWWDVAIKTPIFNKELLELKKDINTHLIYAGIGYEVYKALRFFNIIKISNLIKNTLNDKEFIDNQKRIKEDIFGLCCMLGEMVMHARKYKKKSCSVFLKAFKMVKMHKKYANLSRVD